MLQLASQFLSILEEHWFQPCVRIATSIGQESFGVLRDQHAMKALKPLKHKSSIKTSISSSSSSDTSNDIKETSKASTLGNRNIDTDSNSNNNSNSNANANVYAMAEIIEKEDLFNPVRAKRDGSWGWVETESLVPGDVIALGRGVVRACADWVTSWRSLHLSVPWLGLAPIEWCIGEPMPVSFYHILQ